MPSLTPRAACDAGQLLCQKTNFARCPSKLGRHSPRCSAKASSSSVEMPGGVFWLDKMSHNNDVVYGEVRRALLLLSMPWPYSMSFGVFVPNS